MEKKIWVKPEMNEVAFAADEYVAACYSGMCDIDAGNTGSSIVVDDDYYKAGGILGLQGTWEFGSVTKFLYKLFFAWNDTNGDGVVQWADNEVDLNNVVNSSNTACDEPFNAEGNFTNVASPDTYFYRDTTPTGVGLDYVWKPVTEISESTKWTTAYHFYGSNSTHLCSVLNESGKS